ncbi:MAG: zinc ribbon domain-containing protein [Desulfuromonadales bacterium]|nr:zinc ribbon domain-containing protein [Desulfuromonadales bacterium]
MPIYEYRCFNCEKVTEKISSVKLKEINCPDCGARAERIVSIFSGKSDSAPSSGGACTPGSGFS